MALGARGPRLLEEVKADRAREGFDERGRALDELGVYVTHLIQIVVCLRTISCTHRLAVASQGLV